MLRQTRRGRHADPGDLKKAEMLTTILVSVAALVLSLIGVALLEREDAGPPPALRAQVL